MAKKTSPKSKSTKKTASTAKKSTAKKSSTAKKASPKGRKPSSRNAASKAKTPKGKATKATTAKSKTRSTGEEEVTLDRRRNADRRGKSTSVKPAPNMERREKVQRRRQIDPTTCERDYSNEEVEFMNAMDDYKRKSGRMFPTCSEVLEVIRGLGYLRLSPVELAVVRPVVEPTEIAPQETPEETLDSEATLEALVVGEVDEF